MRSHNNTNRLTYTHVHTVKVDQWISALEGADVPQLVLGDDDPFPTGLQSNGVTVEARQAGGPAPESSDLVVVRPVPDPTESVRHERICMRTSQKRGKLMD